MASTVSVGNISLQQLEWNAAGHRRHCRPTDITHNSLENEYLSSFPAESSSDSMGSHFNLAVETWENKSTSSDGRHTSKFNHTNDAVYQNQTLVNAEFEEIAKEAETRKEEKVYDAIQGESIVPLIKEHGENFAKRTFSTFSISLPREKIEADLLAMGGSKRSRRIKKRPKTVQRQLDDLFPGLRLKYITRDKYRVRMT